MRIKNEDQYSPTGKRRPPSSYIFIGEGMTAYTWREVINGEYVKIAAIFKNSNDATQWIASLNDISMLDRLSVEVKHICRSIHGNAVIDHFTRKPVIDLFTGKPNCSVYAILDKAIYDDRTSTLKMMVDKIKKRIKQIKFELKYRTSDASPDELRNELHKLKAEYDNHTYVLESEKLRVVSNVVDKSVNVKRKKPSELMTHREKVEARLLPGEEYDEFLDG